MTPMSGHVPESIGGYTIEARVGGGGMAEIFRARPPPEFREALGRELVAIKTLLPSFARDPVFREMFVEEGEIATTIDHPNVVEILDVGEATSGDLFLVMEWVDGLDLSCVLRSFRRRRLRLHPIAACTIVEQALRGLHAAHTRTDRDGFVHPVVHRDVSPANLLLAKSGVVKVADFGLARPLERARKTLPGIVKGKFAYLAPEQAWDRPVDPRADVFASAIVLWEALAGRHLFRRDDDRETVLLVRRAEAPDVRRYAPDLDGRVVAALRRALAADPDLRPPSALAFAEELAVWLRQQKGWSGSRVVASVVRDVLRAEAPAPPEPELLASAPVPLVVRKSGRPLAAKP
jgi:serine/threonine-protein kinase